MGVQRGFKAYAERLALELRAEMRLQPHDRICCFALAKHLDVPVFPFADHTKDLPHAEREALYEQFHGLTVAWRPGRAVLYNERNSPPRQQSDLAHELSHVLLQHPMADVVLGGHRNSVYEEEAAILSGALLVPRAAVVYLLQQPLSDAQAAAVLGVSEQMFTYRANVTGARIRQGKWGKKAALG